VSAPEYAPSSPFDAPRPGEFDRMPIPRPYVVRPNEQATIPQRPTFGTPGPDAGYALHLARTLEGRLELAVNERASDALAAGCVLAMKRAARFGRAPIKRDVEVGLAALGYLGDAPCGLVAWRSHELFGIATDYHLQRRLADGCAATLLTASVEQVRTMLPRWRQMLGIETFDRYAT